MGPKQQLDLIHLVRLCAPGIVPKEFMHSEKYPKQAIIAIILVH
jgi:hypothetical protein